MHHHDNQEGWERLEDEAHVIAPTTTHTHTRNHSKLPARDILSSYRHSLAADMLLGWKPRMPSYPIPLSYHNSYTNVLPAHLPPDRRFKLAYLGPRYSNSVQLNQQYNYFWRYRSRYNSSICAAISEGTGNTETQGAQGSTKYVQGYRDEGERSRLAMGRRVAVERSEKEPSFDSAFQSGNLDMAVLVKQRQYDLFLRCDTNTRGHTAWFYFKVENREEVGEFQFNICNFAKRKTLYDKGMKPYACALGQWTQQACYQVNLVQRYCRYGLGRKNSQLHFKYNFKHKHQTVLFAYSLPYTYSRLQNFISQVAKNSIFANTSRLCQSLGGLDVPLLTITNTPSEQQSHLNKNTDPVQKTRKKVVLITGRIHSGQTHSSFIVEGLVRYLLSGEPTAHALRESHVFYVVPMLNPDGVVVGNLRTSLSGKDLNRQFHQLNKHIFPQITALYELAAQLKKDHRSEFQMYLDFHSHSSKRGLFCYGPEHPIGKPQYFKCRSFAKLIEQQSPIFNYDRSVFKIGQRKKTTGRAHMLYKLKIPLSFAFEVSNGLYSNKDTVSKSFTEKILFQLGTAVMKGLFKFEQLQARFSKFKARIKNRKGMITKGSKSKLKAAGHSKNDNQAQDMAVECLIDQIAKQEAQDCVEQQQGGSDSESEGQDLQAEELLKLHRMIEENHKDSQFYCLSNKSSPQHNPPFRPQSQCQESKPNNIRKKRLKHSIKQGPSKRLVPLKSSKSPNPQSADIKSPRAQSPQAKSQQKQSIEAKSSQLHPAYKQTLRDWKQTLRSHNPSKEVPRAQTPWKHSIRAQLPQAELPKVHSSMQSSIVQSPMVRSPVGLSPRAHPDQTEPLYIKKNSIKTQKVMLPITRLDLKL